MGLTLGLFLLSMTANVGLFVMFKACSSNRDAWKERAERNTLLLKEEKTKTGILEPPKPPAKEEKKAPQYINDLTRLDFSRRYKAECDRLSSGYDPVDPLWGLTEREKTYFFDLRLTNGYDPMEGVQKYW